MANPTIRKRPRLAEPQAAQADEGSPPPSSINGGSSSRERRSDYDVGYGKPPRHSQFQPGASGNPRGRPKGAKSFAALVEQALDEKVTIVERGRERKISRREIGARRIANKVAEGDPKVLAFFLKGGGERRGSQAAGSQPPPDPQLNSHERSLMATLLEMGREAAAEGGENGDANR